MYASKRMNYGYFSHLRFRVIVEYNLWKLNVFLFALPQTPPPPPCSSFVKEISTNQPCVSTGHGCIVGENASDGIVAGPLHMV